MPFLRGLLAALVLLASGTAIAQDWPTRPVRFVVPWPPGGLNDVLARASNDRVSVALGQTVVTDFRAGAGGRVGVAEVARAAPDGYTIGMGNLGPLTIFPTLYRQMPFDVKKDLIPVTMFAASPLVLVVSGESPVRTLPELIAAAKQKPGTYNFASVGIGGPQHLIFELLKSRAGFDMVHVPYKGTTESLPAILAGDVHATFDTLPFLLPHIRSGKVRALAVSTPARVPQLPDVPTLKELQLGDTDVVTWYGLIVPARTPRPIVERLYREYTAVAQLPEVQKLLAEQGLITIPNTTAEFQARIDDETKRWAAVIRDNRIEVAQ